MRHFKLAEFDCKCGTDCGKTGADMDTKFLAWIVEARDLAGVPFVITSGIRCKFWNAHEGGSSTSSHLKGLAADIKCGESPGRYEMLNALLELGFSRIGVRKDFIHVDLDGDKPNDLIWLY